MITVNTIPFELSKQDRKRSDSKFIEMIANQNLIASRNGIKRDLEESIPVHFYNDITLFVSINKTNFKTKIDYSRIQSKSDIRIIKAYLSGDEYLFWNLCAKI
ncbi:hypothetical protein [Flavobacterium sp. LM4]|uniref:hypothetical protein n=1 Tax=Flavobacterium sp. LM4 TaxID=1938609 RepID=UPI000994407E|nr:hypothetical protein [Flavobacterium sp. LM4]OOV20308.1 hypothetical protein BXU10_12065 [Flavobacterium sp. LM4]